MLVLSRKENETIELPAIGVVIRIFGFSRRRVQVGIEAPISLKITRGEQRQPHSDNSVDSIAEFVIGEDFEALEADLATLCELAETRDCSAAQKVTADARNRISRLKRTVAESIRVRSSGAGVEQRANATHQSNQYAASNDRDQCVRESAHAYVTHDGQSTCAAVSVS